MTHGFTFATQLQTEQVHVFKLHPCLVSDEQTEQENIKKAHSRRETGKPGGTRRVMSEHYVIIKKNQTNHCTDRKDHGRKHIKVGSICKGGAEVYPWRKRERGLAGRRSIKPSLPNAAICKQHIPEKMR